MRLRFLACITVFAAPDALCAQNPPMATAPSASVEIAATVNGEIITVAELDAILNAEMVRVPLTQSQRRQLRAALLEDVIDEKLIRQFLAKNAPKVDPTEIEAQMTTLKAQLIKENRTLADFLKQTGQTEAQLRDEWLARLQLMNYVKQQATDDKLKEYHAANRDHFDKVEVRVSHIVIRVGKNSPPVERASAKEKLQAIRVEVVAGKATFATAAKKYSQCPSALKNGDLGFIFRRGLPEDEPLAKAAFALNVGAVSDVVETDRGFHLITVTDRKPGTPTALEKCVVEVLEAYADDFRIDLAKKLRMEGKVKVTLP